MLIIVTTILALTLGVAFTAAGCAKVTDQPVMLKARDHLGLGPELYRAVGMVELVGAIGVLLGLFSVFNLVGIVSAVGLATLMLGAVIVHLKARDAGRELLPALSMAGLSSLYLTTMVAA